MKILQVNKYYYPRGGADQYFLSLSAAQTAAGHEVAVFAMDHPKNLETPWSKYFVSRISFNGNSFSDRLRTPGRVLYSLEAKRKFAALLDEFGPDIIHCHNIYHQLSPSILDTARERGIPVVMHLHDYKLIAANHAMFASGGHLCDPESPLACLKRRCIKDSFLATTLALFEMWLHHRVLKIYERGVSIFIAPSRFMADIVIRYGQPAEKVRVVYNPYDPNILAASGKEEISEDYLLYFGRLSSEKGIDVLIRAAAICKRPVKIVGDGPESEKLRSLAAKFEAPIEFLGYKSGSELASLIKKSRAVVVPSIWRENMPLSLLEAMSSGKTVIASRIGGLPEMIEDSITGLLFVAGDHDDLAEQIRRLDQLDLSLIGNRARERVSKLTPAENLKAVMDIYKKLMK